jgi:hypothetical protein
MGCAPPLEVKLQISEQVRRITAMARQIEWHDETSVVNEAIFQAVIEESERKQQMHPHRPKLGPEYVTVCLTPRSFESNLDMFDSGDLEKNDQDQQEK